jgi:dolichol-phosphate mannosyltransferase
VLHRASKDGLGRAYVEGWPLDRRILSRSANSFARFMPGVPFAGLTGGFKVRRADALRSVG